MDQSSKLSPQRSKSKAQRLQTYRMLTLVFMFGLMINHASYAQILNNSTKISEKVNQQPPVGVLPPPPETLRVPAATIDAIRSTVATTSIPSLDASNDLKKILDSLSKERSRFETLNKRFQNDSEALVKAREKVRAAQERFNTVESTRKKQAVDSLQKAREEESKRIMAELKSRAEATTAIARNQSAANKLSASLMKRLYKADSTSSLPDSLNVLLNNLLPDLRIKVAKNTFLANNLHTLFDSTHTLKRRIALNDSLSEIDASYSGIAEDNLYLISRVRDALKVKVVMAARIKLLWKKIDNGNKRLDEEANFDTNERIDAYKRTIDLTTDQFKLVDSSLREEVNPAIADASIEYKEILKQYIGLVDRFKKTTDQLNKIQKNNINQPLSKAKTDEMDFGALPSLTQLIGENRAPNLNISVVGSFSSTNDTINSTFESRIFTANLPKELYQPKALFIPELSTFGIQVKYSLGWETRSNFGRNAYLNHRGINIDINLLNKRILDETKFPTGDDLTNFIAHLRAGFEQVIVKDRMSVYANVSWMGLVDNVKNFHRQYDEYLDSSKKNTFWFGDFGARFLLLPNLKNVTTAGDLQIFADINFVLPGSWGRGLMQTDDRIMTLVKIGFKKSLGVIHRSVPK